MNPVRGTLRSKANAPTTRQGSFHSSTLLLAFLHKKIHEQSRNWRADVSHMRKSSLSARRMTEAGAQEICPSKNMQVQRLSKSKSRVNLSTVFLSEVGVLRESITKYEHEISKSCSQIERPHLINSLVRTVSFQAQNVACDMPSQFEPPLCVV